MRSLVFELRQSCVKLKIWKERRRGISLQKKLKKRGGKGEKNV